MDPEDNTIKLMLGYLCISSESEASLVRKVEILDRFKLKDTEIAQICACNQQSVRNARLALKKTSQPNAKNK
jgi:hypothetical protein